MYVEEDTTSVVVLANRQDDALIDRLAWDLLAHYLPVLEYPSVEIDSPEGREWGRVVLGAIEAVRAGRSVPSVCSKPLRMFLESESGRGVWQWYFARGFPTSIACVDVEDIGGARQYHFRLGGPGVDEYRLTAVVDDNNELVRLFW
jgi:hypothetical protein